MEHMRRRALPGGSVQVLRQTTVALSIGFTAILACMLGSIYIGFQHLELTRGAWQRDAFFREKVRSAFLMREAVRERSFHLTFATSMDDFFDRDEQRQAYDAKAVSFLLARDKLVDFHMTLAEKTAMDALIKRIGELRPSIDNAMDLVVDRKSTRLNSSHRCISYAVFCLKKKRRNHTET